MWKELYLRSPKEASYPSPRPLDCLSSRHKPTQCRRWIFLGKRPGSSKDFYGKIKDRSYEIFIHFRCPSARLSYKHEKGWVSFMVYLRKGLRRGMILWGTIGVHVSCGSCGSSKNIFVQGSRGYKVLAQLKISLRLPGSQGSPPKLHALRPFRWQTGEAPLSTRQVTTS